MLARLTDYAESWACPRTEQAWFSRRASAIRTSRTGQADTSKSHVKTPFAPLGTAEAGAARDLVEQTTSLNSVGDAVAILHPSIYLFWTDYTRLHKITQSRGWLGTKDTTEHCRTPKGGRHTNTNTNTNTNKQRYLVRIAGRPPIATPS